MKKFKRSDEDYILGGVCGGLANYFNKDVSLIRLIVGLLVFCTGIGFLAYLILWFCSPSEY